MAEKCAICGAEINIFQTQKLIDGNYICRKTCRAKGFKIFDYVHATLPQVKAHISQVEQGTKLWEHYFVPRLNEKGTAKELVTFGNHFYVAEDLGLMAYIQNDYKFFIFGKTTRACVYRIADLCDYDYEEQEVKNGDKVEKKRFVHVSFLNTEGLCTFSEPINSSEIYRDMAKYFDELFGIKKTLGNKNAWKAQAAAVKNLSAELFGTEDANDRAAMAAAAIDRSQYGDRTELIRRADAALSAFNE